MATPGTARFPELAATPSVPPSGYALIYMKTDNVLYILDSGGVETPIGTASGITSLTGDVIATGPGAAAALVAFVGGKTAAEIATSVNDTQAATSANTFNVIVKRDSSGNIFVTQINGVVIEAHAARHLPAGADPLTTAAPTTNLSATTTNTTGTANSLARSDHTHAINTGAASTQTPNQANATGVSSNIARADHTHNIPTAAPTTTLSPATTNAQGSASSFSNSDHTHAVATSLVGDITTIHPNDTASAGIVDKFARGDHKHAIATAAPVTQNTDQTNTDGVATTFSKSDHIHNIPTDVPVDISTTNAQGSSVKFSKADHTHKGVRSLKANSGTQRFGDLSLQSGVGATVTDDGSGNFTIDTVGGTSELSVSYPGSGLTVNYTAGKVIFNGTQTFVAAGSVAVPSSTTNGYVYVDIDGVVKAAASLPPNTVPLEIFTSSLTTITFLEDARVFLNHSLVWGLSSDIQPETTTSAVSAGTSEKYARADHVHAISSAAAVTQNPDQANAAGSSTSFSKADHIHNIPTAVAVTLNANSTDTQGSSTSFARADHTHAITTGTVSTQTPDQANAAGSSANLTRADHTHNIPTATAIGLDATSTNTQGSAATFGRSDHTHAISTGPASTQTPDQANATGTSANLARADHVHNVPTAAPTTNLTASTTNADGSAATFSRSDHSHAISTGTPSTQVPDQANAIGTSPNIARADHIHDIPSGTPVQIGTSNFPGAAASFALSDHVHAHGNQTSPTLHAVATPSANGFMSSTDKAKLDTVSATAGTDAQILISDGTTYNPKTVSGDVSLTDTGVVTIGAGIVTDAKSSLATKPSVAVVATSNLVLSGLQTIDGVTVAVNTLVLLTAQTTPSQNGPWQAQVAGWTRPTWYPSGGTTQAFQFITCFVRLGTTYQGSVWRQTAAAPITIDTTSTTWVITPLALNSSTVSGTLPNANTTATSANTPSTIVQRDSSGNFSATTITANLTGNASGTASNVTGIVATPNGGTGLSAIGTSNQVLGVNSGATALEYKSLVGTANQVIITDAVGSKTFSTPQDINTTSKPTFAGENLTDRLELTEQSAPTTPAATKADIYLQSSNGFSRLRYLDSTGMTSTILRDTILLVKNVTGSTLTKGRAVYYTGTDAGTNLPTVALAKADSSNTVPAIGLLIEDITNTSVGRVLISGIVSNIDTSAFSQGDKLYLSATTAGILTSTKPVSPNIWQRIGIVLISNASTGSIEVRPFGTHGEESGTNTGYTLNTVALTDAATIAVDASKGNIFTVTLGGNRTLGAPTNPTDGQKITFRISQDGTGGRTLAFDAIYRFGLDILSVVLSTGANKTDYIGVIYNSAATKWDVVAVSKGF